MFFIVVLERSEGPIFFKTTLWIPTPREASAAIDGRKESARLSEINAGRVIYLDRRDLLNEEKLRQVHKTQELARFNNKGRDFEIGG
jgi:hypothetical protein